MEERNDFSERKRIRLKETVKPETEWIALTSDSPKDGFRTHFLFCSA